MTKAKDKFYLALSTLKRYAPLLNKFFSIINQCQTNTLSNPGVLSSKENKSTDFLQEYKQDELDYCRLRLEQAQLTDRDELSSSPYEEQHYYNAYYSSLKEIEVQTSKIIESYCAGAIFDLLHKILTDMANEDTPILCTAPNSQLMYKHNGVYKQFYLKDYIKVARHYHAHFTELLRSENISLITALAKERSEFNEILIRTTEKGKDTKAIIFLEILKWGDTQDVIFALHQHSISIS